MASGKARSSATSDFRVGSWLARPARNHVCNGETLRHLEPQVMDLRAFLASRGGQVVSRDEIIDAVWDGRFIAETTLTRAIADLRRALGDSRLEDAQGLEGLRVWFDLIYLQRYNPHLRPFFEWVGFGTTFAQTASAVDHGAILDMVERHEGSLSAAIARHWLERQPDAFLTVRSVTAELIGFVCHLRLEPVTPEDVAVDPAVANAIAHMERHGPPGAGEHTVYSRFWTHRDRHQAQVLAPVAASCSQNWTAPGLAWCFIAVADPDLTEPMFAELHIWRVREADFEVGGRRYGVFAHDWRVENAEQWLRLKAERAWRIEHATGSPQGKPVNWRTGERVNESMKL